MATLKYTNKNGEIVSISSYTVNNVDVVQDIGQSTADVMSLKAVTDNIINILSDIDGKVDKVNGKSLSTNDYTNEEKSKLESLPEDVYSKDEVNTLGNQIKAIAEATKELVNTALSTKANIEDIPNIKYEEVINNPLLEEIDTLTREEIKKDLFIDMWNQAWGTYGKYDPANAPDAEHPFMGNGIWMTYEEALEVYRDSSNFGGTTSSVVTLLHGSMRTNIPIIAHTLGATISRVDTNNIEVLALISVQPGGCFNLTQFVLSNLPYLRKIVGPLRLGSVASNNFVNLPSLTDMELRDLSISINMSSIPKLSQYSFAYMIGYAANTTAITITVHPNVYAKLTGDTTNSAAAALTSEELAQWTLLVTDAQAKNITFATV